MMSMAFCVIHGDDGVVHDGLRHRLREFIAGG